MGERDELVGRVAHRREDGDDAAAFLLRGDDPPRDGLEPLRVADGRAAELHHERADAPASSRAMSGTAS